MAATIVATAALDVISSTLCLPRSRQVSKSLSVSVLVSASEIQGDGVGDDGRMPIMCGHKVMKILSDSGNSCTLSAIAFDLILDRTDSRRRDLPKSK